MEFHKVLLTHLGVILPFWPEEVSDPLRENIGKNFITAKTFVLSALQQRSEATLLTCESK